MAIVMVRPEVSSIMIGPDRSGLPLPRVSGPSCHSAESLGRRRPGDGPHQRPPCLLPQCRHEAKL